MFLSYRNQSIRLLAKLMDWFLYDRALRNERANSNFFGTYFHLTHLRTVSLCENGVFTDWYSVV